MKSPQLAYILSISTAEAQRSQSRPQTYQKEVFKKYAKGRKILAGIRYSSR
jgi:hypothetical protein